MCDGFIVGLANPDMPALAFDSSHVQAGRVLRWQAPLSTLPLMVNTGPARMHSGRIGLIALGAVKFCRPMAPMTSRTMPV